MKTFKTSLFAGALALAAMGQSACTKTGQTDNAGQANQQNGAAQSPLSRAAAEQMALAKYPDSYLLSTEIELEDDKTFYEIDAKVAAQVYQLTIDAATGEIVKTKDSTLKFRADSTKGKAPLWKVDLAARNAAEEAAIKAYPGQTQQWKAVTDAGREAFAFEIKNEAGEIKKILVQAGTNEVLEEQ